MERRQHIFHQYDFSKWAWFFSPSVLLLIPFVHFVKSNAYPVLSPAIFLGVLGILICGLVLGFAAQFGRSAQTIILSGTLTLVIDIQTDLLFDYSLHQYVWLPLGLYVLIFLAPRFIQTFLLVVIYLTATAILISPSSPRFKVADFRDVPFDGQDMPRKQSTELIWIHIILDEVIGVESIPIEFDPDRRLAEHIKNEYVGNGFTVFGRAFTRFTQTHLSLPNILNLDARHPAQFIDTVKNNKFALKKSKYFDHFRDQGYSIHIYDSQYFEICSLHGDAWTDVCNKIRANSIWTLRNTSISVTDKARVILRIYSRLSKILSKFVSGLELDGRFSIPRSIAPLGTAKILARFREDILKTGPGSVWLLHMPVPHYPYALKSDCDIRSWPWLEAGARNSPDEDSSYIWNSETSRQTRYPLYLEQVECIHEMLQTFFLELKKSGIFDKASIIVHGDHGSRIAIHNLKSRQSYRPDFQPSSQTILDYLGTFFAYKPAGRPIGQYRREMVSVADLLRDVVFGRCCNKTADEPDPTGYLVEWDAESCRASQFKATKGCRLIPMQIQRFSNGELPDETSLMR